MCGGPLKCGGPCSAEHVGTLVNPALGLSLGYGNGIGWARTIHRMGGYAFD